MDIRPPERPEGPRPQQARLAAGCVGGGVILGAAALTCLGLHVISAQQAIAIGLPGVALIAVGLILAAARDAGTGEQGSYEAGFRMGWLLSRLGSIFRWRRNGF